MQITGKCKLQKMIPSFGHESDKMFFKFDNSQCWQNYGKIGNLIKH